MLRAVEQMAEAARLPNSPEAQSLFVLITATQSKLIEADDAHAIEGVARRGTTGEMTPGCLTSADQRGSGGIPPVFL